MQQLAQRAFITYLRSIHIQKDKDIFDVTKLSVEEFSASLGLPMTPKIRFLKQKNKSKMVLEKVSASEKENSAKETAPVSPKKDLLADEINEEQVDKDIVQMKDAQEEGKANLIEDVMYVSLLFCFWSSN